MVTRHRAPTPAAATKAAQPQKATSWSFSRYRDYSACPLAFKLKHLMKLGEKENAAMLRGTAIHAMAEKYIKNRRSKLPAELSLFKEQFAAVRKIPSALAEDSWTFDKAWQQCEWNDWDRAWLRVKVDLHYFVPEENLLVVIDHKTGKHRPYKEAEYLEQIDLTATAGLLRYPDVEYVLPLLWYVDEGTEYPQDADPVARSQLPKMIKVWEKKTKAMLSDTTFKPKPNSGCQYCPFSASKGGQCKF